MNDKKREHIKRKMALARDAKEFILGQSRELLPLPDLIAAVKAEYKEVAEDMRFPGLDIYEERTKKQQTEVSRYLAEIGRKGGRSKSWLKQLASAKNGELGGRPAHKKSKRSARES